ncbi:MAG: sugar ABC transporter permease [Spirochaetes bacterium]|nr:MAG: sugar ABC transporter permease [Spirochaetota bacterium]
MQSLSPQLFAKSLGEVGTTILFVLVAIIAIEFLLYYILKVKLNHVYALPFMLVAPAAIGLLLLVAYPIGYNAVLSFTNMSLRRFTVERGLTYGIKNAVENFVGVFTEPILKQRHFFPILFTTVLWTFIQVSSHVVLGMFLAILLNRPMKLRGIYRTLLLFPWAIPQIIAVLAWRGEFNYEYGYPNVILKSLGLEPIRWLSDPFWNFAAINITNIWLGVPFMTVVLLGGLQSIDRTYYEASEIDGAGKIYQFSHITLPLIQPVMTPAVILGVIWTFNMFNIPFFINQLELESSDILVTALFRAAFEYNRYGFAAAFALVNFFILLVFTLAYLKLTRFKFDVGTLVTATGKKRR